MLINFWSTVVAIITCYCLSQNLIKGNDINMIPIVKNKMIFEDSRQLSRQKNDVSTPNFIRLVLLRLLYGIATNMGLEDQLEDVFNGALIPPSSNDALDFEEYGDDDDSPILLENIFSDEN